MSSDTRLLLKFIYNMDPRIFKIKLEEFMKEGDIEMVRLIKEYHPIDDIRLGDLAAKTGNLSIIKFLYDDSEEHFTHEAVINACSKGYLDVIKFIHSVNIHPKNIDYFTPNAMDNAAATCHIEVVKWLHFNRKEGCTENAMNWAAKKGHLDVVRWLYENRLYNCDLIQARDSSQYQHCSSYLDKILDIEYNEIAECIEPLFL